MSSYAWIMTTPVRAYEYIADYILAKSKSASVIPSMSDCMASLHKPVRVFDERAWKWFSGKLLVKFDTARGKQRIWTQIAYSRGGWGENAEFG